MSAYSFAKAINFSGCVGYHSANVLPSAEIFRPRAARNSGITVSKMTAASVPSRSSEALAHPLTNNLKVGLHLPLLFGVSGNRSHRLDVFRSWMGIRRYAFAEVRRLQTVLFSISPHRQSKADKNSAAHAADRRSDAADTCLKQILRSVGGYI